MLLLALGIICIVVGSGCAFAGILGIIIEVQAYYRLKRQPPYVGVLLYLHRSIILSLISLIIIGGGIYLTVRFI